jgi:1-aminocyclopropane-1-carboxylate deaminase
MGGYARHNPELIGFIQGFYRQYGILLDPVYTSKMMFGLMDLIRMGYFEEGSSICAIHTGGLQGWNGFTERFGIDPATF